MKRFIWSAALVGILFTEAADRILNLAFKSSSESGIIVTSIMIGGGIANSMLAILIALTNIRDAVKASSQQTSIPPPPTNN